MSITVAAFDFDKTITTQDVLLRFLYDINPGIKNYFKTSLLMPVWLGYKTGFLNNQVTKEKLLSRFLNNTDLNILTEKAKIFAREKIPDYVKPEALTRLAWHREQGHICLIVSAGLEIYLKPWAEALGIDDVLATQLEATGKIKGKNCFGQEKVNRLLERLGPKENFKLYAYGDSRGDRELLALADYPYYRVMPACG